MATAATAAKIFYYFFDIFAERLLTMPVFDGSAARCDGDVEVDDEACDRRTIFEELVRHRTIFSMIAAQPRAQLDEGVALNDGNAFDIRWRLDLTRRYMAFATR